MTNPAPTEIIVAFLLKNGWEEVRGIKNPTGIGLTAAGFVATGYSTRRKFVLNGTDRRVTVGPRTTCFYEVVDKQAVNPRNYSTKNNLEEIKKETP